MRELFYTSLLIVAGFLGHVNAQTIYEEDFTGQSGTIFMDPDDPVNVARTAGKGTAILTGPLAAARWVKIQDEDVDGGPAQMEAFVVNNSAGNEVIWTSDPIDVSCVTEVDIAMILFARDRNTSPDNNDYIRAFYQLDGGSEVKIGEGLGSFSPPVMVNEQNIATSGASELQIVIRINNDRDRERHGFDDIVVSGIEDCDGDGIPNDTDNCPDDYNKFQQDDDGDGIGNKCDPFPYGDPPLDGDGDGVPDDMDNCPEDYNKYQQDDDGDGIGNVCDPFPYGDPIVDGDGDGISDDTDNCPDDYNKFQQDDDGDGIGNKCDPNPYVPDVDFKIPNDQFDSNSLMAPVDFRLYPNPAKEELFLQFGEWIERPATIEVFNTMGQQVLLRTMGALQDQERIELPELPDGMYLIRVRVDGQQPVTKKFLVGSSSIRP